MGWLITFSDISERKRLEAIIGKYTAELERANKQLRSIPSKLIYVQEEERKRLAGELHDSIGQTLAALKFRVEAILHAADRDLQGALKLLKQFVPTLQRSLDETRATYMGLRPTMLEERGLIETLNWFCRELMSLHSKHHIELDLGVEEQKIPEDLKVVIFRITQEALNNVAKHSKAEWVALSLQRNGNGIELTIQDDGVGMDLDFLISNATTARSLGLTGMKERAELAGGSLLVESTPGEGTTVRASWPLIT